MAEQQDYSHVAFGRRDWIPVYGLYNNSRKVKEKGKLMEAILLDETMKKTYSVIVNGVKTGEIDGPMSWIERRDFAEKLPEAYPKFPNLFFAYHLSSPLLLEVMVFGFFSMMFPQ